MESSSDDDDLEDSDDPDKESIEPINVTKINIPFSTCDITNFSSRLRSITNPSHLNK
jgi:hypothetical protein